MGALVTKAQCINTKKDCIKYSQKFPLVDTKVNFMGVDIDKFYKKNAKLSNKKREKKLNRILNRACKRKYPNTVFSVEQCCDPSGKSNYNGLAYDQNGNFNKESGLFSINLSNGNDLCYIQHNCDINSNEYGSCYKKACEKSGYNKILDSYDMCLLPWEGMDLKPCNDERLCKSSKSTRKTIKEGFVASNEENPQTYLFLFILLIIVIYLLRLK